tara:strand:+ start:13240 stop:13512 length:273 start_codon:yes stop_codon:yes gene_type:complete
MQRPKGELMRTFRLTGRGLTNPHDPESAYVRVLRVQLSILHALTQAETLEREVAREFCGAYDLVEDLSHSYASAGRLAAALQPNRDRYAS